MIVRDSSSKSMCSNVESTEKISVAKDARMRTSNSFRYFGPSDIIVRDSSSKIMCSKVASTEKILVPEDARMRTSKLPLRDRWSLLYCNYTVY